MANDKSTIDYENVETTAKELETLYNSRVKRDDIIESWTPHITYYKKTPINFSNDLAKMNKDIKKLIDVLNTAYDSYKKAEGSNKDKKNSKTNNNKKLKTNSKDKEKFVNDIIAGKYGNGEARKKALRKALKKAGYKGTNKQIAYLQKLVNKKLSNSKVKNDISTGATVTTSVSNAIVTSNNKNNSLQAKPTKKVESVAKKNIDAKTKKTQKENKELKVKLKETKAAKSAATAAFAEVAEEKIADLTKQNEAKIADLTKQNEVKIADLTKQNEAKINELKEEIEITTTKAEQKFTEATNEFNETIATKDQEINSLKEQVNNLQQQNNQTQQQLNNSNQQLAGAQQQAAQTASSQTTQPTVESNPTQPEVVPEETPATTETPEVEEPEVSTEVEEPIVIEPEPETTTGNNSSQGGSSVIPAILGVGAAGAATVAGVRYIKNKNKSDDDYEEGSSEDNYDDQDSNNETYAYESPNSESIPSERYRAGSINKLVLDEQNDININDDYEDDDQDEELE